MPTNDPDDYDWISNFSWQDLDLKGIKVNYFYGKHTENEFRNCNFRHAIINLTDAQNIGFFNCDLRSAETAGDGSYECGVTYENCLFDLHTGLVGMDEYNVEDYSIEGCKLELNGKQYDLDKMVVCFTGVRDAELEGQMKMVGVKVVSSITKDCNVLIAKDKNSTSSKAQKVTKQGGTIVAYDDIRKFFSFVYVDTDEYCDEDE